MKKKIVVDWSFAPGIGLGIYYLCDDKSYKSIGIALPFLIIEVYLKRKNK